MKSPLAQTVAMIVAVTALDVVVEPVHQESELAVVGAAAIALLAIDLNWSVRPTGAPMIGR